MKMQAGRHIPYISMAVSFLRDPQSHFGRWRSPIPVTAPGAVVPSAPRVVPPWRHRRPDAAAWHREGLVPGLRLVHLLG